MSDKQPPTPLPASTVLLLRDGAEGLEVFMVRRTTKMDFAAGALVFPGGKVELSDGLPMLRERCGLGCAEAQPLLGAAPSYLLGRGRPFARNEIRNLRLAQPVVRQVVPVRGPPSSRARRRVQRRDRGRHCG